MHRSERTTAVFVEAPSPGFFGPMTAPDSPLPRHSPVSELVTDYAGETALESMLETPGERVYLVVRSGGSTMVKDLAPGEAVTIGRASDCAVVVDEQQVSRHHAEIRWRDGTVELTDLGSRNGTRVNVSKVHGGPHHLQGGDVIRVGSVEVLVAVARALDEDDAADEPAENAVAADPAMQRVYALARRLAVVDTTALLLGETGVGKEVVAQQIHRWSPRSGAPFVRLSCANLPASLLESELFGYERGAFTGAAKSKAGYFELAAGGTLFLDEVGEVPLETQVKLLTVLESREMRRLGGTADVKVDARLVAATNRDLEAEVAKGRFRQDLFYRLSVFTLHVPPLRDRPLEIPLLADHFAREHAALAGRPAPAIDPAAARALARHTWPGNVRELKNAVEHAVVLADDVIRVEHLPEALRERAPEPGSSHTVRDRVDDFERREITAALEAEHGNQTRAARRLGITRRALIYRMKKHGMA